MDQSGVRDAPQHGMNPDVRNKKGYRPIDLAARRGHAECERLLSEYHMHHSTENYFDSVLFVATLHVQCDCMPATAPSLSRGMHQGQQTSRSAMESLDSDGQYEIIRRANPHATPEELRRMHSLWSSRRDRSMRLQQVPVSSAATRQGKCHALASGGRGSPTKTPS
jgi:hypothetical protein